MSKDMTGLRVGILGGDRRDLILMAELVGKGAEVLVAGYDLLSQLPEGIAHKSIREALDGVDAVVLPMSGTDENGTIKTVFSKVPLLLTSTDIDLLKSDTPVLVGVASNYLKSQVSKKNLKLIETAELDDVAVLNSIPTAEGAIELAMREIPITIHGSQLLIFGFGRIGMTLARMLQGIGAQVSVVARKSIDLARIEEQGYNPLTYDTVFSYLNKVNVIFNTVPSLIIKENYLTQLRFDTLIIDLAAAPGGIDFDVASRLGLKAILASGLPGKVAPETAGKILAKVYPKLMLEHLHQGQVGEVGQ